MSCMYPRKKMKPVKSKKKTLKMIAILGGLLIADIGLLMATPTLFRTINDMKVEAYNDTPSANISVYKDKTPYGTCEYLVVEAGTMNGGVSITPRMKHNDSLNGSEHICRK